VKAPTDRIVEDLSEAHATLVAAGKCYLSGDLAGAEVALDDVLVVVREARAAIRRAISAEPSA